MLTLCQYAYYIHILTRRQYVLKEMFVHERKPGSKYNPFMIADSIENRGFPFPESAQGMRSGLHMRKQRCKGENENCILWQLQL